MRSHVQTALLLLAAVLAGAVGQGLHAWAKGAPRSKPLVYRGTLTNAEGTPLGGSHTIKVALFDQETGGEQRCVSPDTTADLTATRGQFAVTLPAGETGQTSDCVKAVQQFAETWAVVTVDGNAFPRSKIAGVPYAIEATHALEADRAASADSLDTPEEVLAQVNAALGKGGKLALSLPPPPLGLFGHEVVSATHALPAVGAGAGFPQDNWRIGCPAGKKLLGGGCATNNGEWFLWVSTPTPDGAGWVCYATNLGNAMSGNNGTGAANASVYAICAQ